MTKDHILKVITHNRRGFAAHQLFKEFEAELEAEHKRFEDLERSILDLSHPNFKILRDQLNTTSKGGSQVT